MNSNSIFLRVHRQSNRKLKAEVNKIINAAIKICYTLYNSIPKTREITGKTKINIYKAYSLHNENLVFTVTIRCKTRAVGIKYVRRLKRCTGRDRKEMKWFEMN